MKKKTVDRIFIFLYFVMGILNLILSIDCISRLKEKCDSNIVRDGLTAIMVVSCILITVGISYFFCNWRGGECYEKNTEDSSSKVYMGLSTFISLAQAVTLILVITQIRGSCYEKTEDGKKLRFNLWAMLILNIIVLGGSSWGVWYNRDTGSKKKEKAKIPTKVRNLTTPRYRNQPKNTINWRSLWDNDDD